MIVATGLKAESAPLEVRFRRLRKAHVPFFMGETYDDRGDEIAYPLIAADPATGKTRAFVSGEGSFATIARDAAGAGVLVFEAPADDDAWRYLTLDPAGNRLALGAGPTEALRLTRATSYQGFETPGFLPVVPGGRFAGVDMARAWALIPLDGRAQLGPIQATASGSRP